MTTVFHAWLYGRFIEIQSNLRRKKLHRTNQGSNFLGGSFSNRVNARAPIQLGRKSQLQHLQRQFFLKHRPIHFHINSTSVIRLVKQNQLSLTSIEINQPLPVPGIFPSTSLQLVNGSKNSILNRVMKLSLFMCFFLFSVFETPLKDFPFYLPILLILWFRYLQTA